MSSEWSTYRCFLLENWGRVNVTRNDDTRYYRNVTLSSLLRIQRLLNHPPRGSQVQHRYEENYWKIKLVSIN